MKNASDTGQTPVYLWPAGKLAWVEGIYHSVYGKFCCLQKIFGMIDTKPGDIFMGSEPRVFLKTPGHMGPAQAEMMAQAVFASLLIGLIFKTIGEQGQNFTFTDMGVNIRSVVSVGLLHFILPVCLSLFFDGILRKKGKIKDWDYYFEL